MKKNKIVYVGLSADILHEGHINIIKTAKKYGEVIVGLLTDKAIASYKSIPKLSYRQREVVLKNIKYIKKVIPQKTLDYSDNLNLIKPNYVVHGDDWKTGIQSQTRLRVIKTLKKMGRKTYRTKVYKIYHQQLLKIKFLQTTLKAEFPD